MSYAIVQGDLEPDMVITLRVNGEPEDISDATTLQMRWRKPDGIVTTVTLVAVDLATGRVKRVWATGDSDVPGRHYGQVRVTRGNGEFQTFPNTIEMFSWEVIPFM